MTPIKGLKNAFGVEWKIHVFPILVNTRFLTEIYCHFVLGMGNWSQPVTLKQGEPIANTEII